MNASHLHTARELLRIVQRWIYRLEDGALVLVLLGMMVLAVYQIVLRNVMGYTLPWIDPLNRAAVLWIALLGAMVGTRLDNHIKIDLAAQFFPLWLGRLVKRFIALCSSVLLALLSWHTWRLVEDERAWSAATVASIPVWVIQIIMPIAFGIMALRYAWMVLFPVLVPIALPTEDAIQAADKGNPSP